MRTTAIKVARGLLWLVYLWVTITLVLLLMLFILQLFGASPTAEFVQWVYRSTERAMAPFRGIFESQQITDASVLDVSVLFAMIVYAFVGLGLHAAVDSVTRTLAAEQDRERQRAYVAAQSAANEPRQVVHMTDPSGLTMTALLVPGASGTSIELKGSGLEPLAAYSAWLEAADGTRVSTAAFQSSPDGSADLAIPTPVALTRMTRFGLTRLPRPGEAGGSEITASLLA